MTRILLAMFVITAFSSASYAAPLSSKAEMKKVANQFMSEIVAGNTAEAYDALKNYLPAPTPKFDAAKEKAIADMKTVAETLGKKSSHAYVKDSEIEDHFYRLAFLQKFETEAIVWVITYYQADKGWHLNGVLYSHNLERLYDD